ncbi:MAG: ECF RNA polymerase sigma-E factor [Bacteroidia bacterium]|nr:ECF RNA polymerase sigma-E factor [Bacteroidia bacterium]
METEDKELLANFRKPESRDSAFNQILGKYQKRIYWHIRKMVIDHDDTDDILQNTFIKVWKGLDNFREDAQLYTWLYRIATNECLTFLTKKKNSNTISINDVEYGLHEKIDSEKNYTGEQIQRKLQKAILTLPEKQRLVFNMKYFDGMKYEEMSAVLDTSVGALKASYHHAVKKIEDFITKG